MQRRVAITLGVTVTAVVVALVAQSYSSIVEWWRLRSLRSPDATERITSLQWLRERGTKRSVSPVVESMLGSIEADRGEERAAGYRALVAVAERDRAGTAHELARVLQRQPHAVYCIGCGLVVRLRHDGEASTTLAAALRRYITAERDPGQRLLAIQAGSRLRGDPAASVLLAAARIPDVENRREIVRRIVGLQSESRARVIRQIEQTARSSTDERRKASIQALLGSLRSRIDSVALRRERALVRP